jgi:hypothetical protein
MELLVWLFLLALGLLIFFLIIKAAINNSNLAADISRIRYLLEHHFEPHNPPNSTFNKDNNIETDYTIPESKDNEQDK